MSEDVKQVAQQIHFVKALASNDKILRRRALKRLKKWLTTRNSMGVKLTFPGCMRLWRGIVYCLWMSDKPLVQEETVDEICSLLITFKSMEYASLFIKSYYRTISEVWMGLDLHRLDKFMMLVRRFLRATFQLLQQNEWDSQAVMTFGSDFYQGLKEAPPGLIFHMADIYLEELAKVGGDELTSDVVLSFLDPWFLFFASNEDDRLAKTISENVFFYLMKQSDLGIEHNVKFEVWKSIGFPGGDISVMDDGDSGNEDDSDEELADDDGEDDDTEKVDNTALDPRAGCVDAVLPTLQFNPGEIISAFKLTLKSSETSVKARKHIKNVIERFQTFAKGRYPLGIHKVELPEGDDVEDDVERAAQDLMSLETKNYVDSLTNKKRVSDYVNLLKDSQAPKKPKIEWIESSDISDNFDENSTGNSGTANLGIVWEVDTIDEDEIVNQFVEHDRKGFHVSQIKTKKRAKQKNKVLVEDKKNITTNGESEISISELEDISSDEVDSNSFNTCEENQTSIGDSKSHTLSLSGKKQRKRKKKSLEMTNTNGESKLNQSTPSKVKQNHNQPNKKLGTFQDSSENILSMTQTSSQKKKQKKKLSLLANHGETINSDGEKEITIPAVRKLKEDGFRRRSFPSDAESKRVIFSLENNLEHCADEYVKSVKNSPTLPYDASKKPYQGVLKHTHLASPINPFFKLMKKHKQKNMLM